MIPVTMTGMLTEEACMQKLDAVDHLADHRRAAGLGAVSSSLSWLVVSWGATAAIRARWNGGTGA